MAEAYKRPNGAYHKAHATAVCAEHIPASGDMAHLFKGYHEITCDEYLAAEVMFK